MPNILEILFKAYIYTKNHKILWFFGFFMSGAGLFDFFNSISRYGYARNLFKYVSSLASKPEALIVIFLIAIALLALGVASRVAIISGVAMLENKEKVTLALLIKKITVYFWRVFQVGLYIDSILLIVFIWLFLPVLYIFSRGLDAKGILLSFIAALIFIIIFAILSLVNMFASCYLVIYELKLLQSLKSSFDILGRFWDFALTLLICLASIYVVFLALSSGILGFFNNLAYLAVILLQSISISLVHLIFIFCLVLLAAIILFLAAILNVYVNTALALLFLNIVKGMPLPKESKSALAEPII